MHRSRVRPATDACWMYALTTLARAFASRAHSFLLLACLPSGVLLFPEYPKRSCAFFMLSAWTIVSFPRARQLRSWTAAHGACLPHQRTSKAHDASYLSSYRALQSTLWTLSELTWLRAHKINDPRRFMPKRIAQTEKRYGQCNPRQNAVIVSVAP